MPFIAVVLAMTGMPAYARPAAKMHISYRSPKTPFDAFIAEAAHRFGIPAAWIGAVMRAESRGQVHAISPKGAMGLMQIMPKTWTALRLRYGLGTDPFDPHDNILAGAAYLRELYDRYGTLGSLAAYNAGPARWDEHVATGEPLPAETRAYLISLAPVVGDGTVDDTMALASTVSSWTDAALFPTRRSDATSNADTAVYAHAKRNVVAGTVQDWTALTPRSDGLFVALSSAGSSR